MDRLLSASQELSKKIDSNEAAASELLHQCELLQQKIKAMIQVCWLPLTNNLSLRESSHKNTGYGRKLTYLFHSTRA